MNRLILTLAVAVPAAFAATDAPAQPATPLRPVAALLARAKTLTTTTARVPLAPGDTKPNFVRALALTPKAAEPMENLFNAIVYQGAIQPEVKLAMALRIAQIYDSPYLAVHANRLMLATEGGKALVPVLGKTIVRPTSAEEMAISYADKLTRGIHAVSDEDFRLIRTRFNDNQIVELTTTTCYFNYLVRFVEATRLPVEPWALTPATAVKSKVNLPLARIGLISDDEMLAVQARVKAAPANNWNIGFANSMRAMYRSPAAASAWFAYGTASREYTAVDRALKLHISFAVSMANGCRYCSLHQVLGLRREGVDVAKLVAMAKDDSQLTPRELTATLFARKLTSTPAAITDADYDGLKKVFGEQGALEVVQQTANFAYMNRFTDGLRLPSEDEAVSVYKETYGKSFADVTSTK
ncbi:MAG: Carboxymuconolactone decarboxylase family protein [Bryobacterales bacterium]|nr:Carboxymuconolactone decarboxylase family protein [Bryobacterales bacterium]